MKETNDKAPISKTHLLIHKGKRYRLVLHKSGELFAYEPKVKRATVEVKIHPDSTWAEMANVVKYELDRLI